MSGGKDVKSVFFGAARRDYLRYCIAEVGREVCKTADKNITLVINRLCDSPVPPDTLLDTARPPYEPTMKATGTMDLMLTYIPTA